MRFPASSEVVLTRELLAERLRVGIYDAIVAEYPGSYGQERLMLDLLRQIGKSVPVVLLGHALNREITAEMILNGAADCLEMNGIAHLPVALHRVLEEKVLRDQRDRAEKNLRRSEARYRALAGNPSYGTCQCGLDGKFLEMNGAMMKMLSCGSTEELLTQLLARDIIEDPLKRAQLLGQSGRDVPAGPVEIEWKRKDGAILKVRLSGQAVLGERGELEAYELIVDDVTKQLELEGQLRKQAASDPLTGLANYRHLVDVLDSEIKRSKRTGREFALLFLDLDGLKLINDQFGHLAGSQALCRLADILSSSCRDIDTSGRYGGDEFALILPETGAQEAHRVARRICESVANDNNGPRLSVSIGVVICPQNGNSIESLIFEADLKLYAMKRQRGCLRNLGYPKHGGS
jgi:diguanylate cyclase (GGDEF)-like protein/PAS domain S-box-containing protein